MFGGALPEGAIEGVPRVSLIENHAATRHAGRSGGT